MDSSERRPETGQITEAEYRLALHRALVAEFALDGLTKPGGADSASQEIIALARRQADEIRDEARVRADSLVAEAQKLKTMAEKAYEEIRQKAEARARDLLSQAEELHAVAQRESELLITAAKQQNRLSVVQGGGAADEKGSVRDAGGAEKTGEPPGKPIEGAEEASRTGR